MTSPPCILFTQDESLRKRMTGYFVEHAHVRHADSNNRLHALIRQFGGSLVIVDLRQNASPTTIQQLVRQFPECVLIALGVPGSDPAIAVSDQIFELVSLEADRRQLVATARRAIRHLKLKNELRLMQETTASPPAASQPSLGLSVNDSRPFLLPLRDLSRAFRHFQRLDLLQDYIVETIAEAVKVSRVGLFAKSADRDDTYYKLRAGIRCHPQTKELAYLDSDPFVQWLSINDHVISHMALDHTPSLEDRLLLRQALSAMGAEIILPLHARNQFLGWLFLGHRASGYPYELSDLEDLSLFAEHISTMLENALLYQETTVQKMLAEALLEALPTGILAIDDRAHILKFNDVAGHILRIDQPANLIGQEIEQTHSWLAHILRQTLQTGQAASPTEWKTPTTQRTLSVLTRPLHHGDRCVGAVAFMEDITEKQLLHNREEELERTRFWADLAASMAHEIRNPLVTIKAFAQLFPESYDQEAFRERFTSLVPHEVDRLDRIVTQIHEFAHPPDINFAQIRPADLIEQAKGDLAPPPDAPTISVDLQDNLPPISVDRDQLAHAIMQLLRNALEATAGAEAPAIKISVVLASEPNGQRHLRIYIDDNGRGIPDELLPNVFSPFCTHKPQGMGLGLPIAKRTILDHSGWMRLERLRPGTRVVLSLPLDKGGSL